MKAKMPKKVRARIKMKGDVPHGALVTLVGALSGEVEGAKLFNAVQITPHSD